MIRDLFNLILFQPLFNLLIFFYSSISFNDMGIAIIWLTFFVKILLYPLSAKALRAQKAMILLNPKIKELKEKYGGKKEELARHLVELYRREKINPLSSVFLLILQIPFLIAVYMVFASGLGNIDFNLLYPFIQKPSSINLNFLNYFNLAEKNLYFALMAGLSQFWQAKMLPTAKPKIETKGSADEELTAMMNKQMLYFAPVLTVIIGSRLPAGLSLYWMASNLLMILQQFALFRKHKDENKR